MRLVCLCHGVQLSALVVGGKVTMPRVPLTVYKDQNLHEYTSMCICIYKYTGNSTAWKNNPVTIMGAVGFWGKEGEPW